MEQILEAFGIDGRLIVIQIFNFVILAGLLWYFLYTPILRIINERQQKIEQGVKEAEAAAKALEAANEEKRSILTEANKEAEQLSARAKEHADEQKSLIAAQAEERASSILADAESKSARLQKEALRKSESEIAKMAVLAAEKILRERS